MSAVNHAQCPPEAHDFDYNPADYGPDAQLQAHDGDVRLCNHCRAVCFYCTRDGQYHHGGKNTPGWFLVPENGTGQCVYARVPGDPAIRVCLTHDHDFGLYGDEACAAVSIGISGVSSVSAPGPLADRDAQITAIAEEFPGWEAWQGLVNGLWHARRIGTVPPVMVHGEGPDDLREQIRSRIGGPS